ncbi:MAG: hypothetical protein EVA74_01200 [Candidatus Pelagibacterales bacterium]|jgi:hypothetical protein|nr:hypothetical protein [Candidatus Pelagibacter sp.]RZO50981.1 MAG: hypothetical protein EVA74_01200 [Pelagibacterales bacterium]|tara:strand:+ start:338 stop:523 length:186 start_codon:yes stop_codon:yes gene_type:complete
MYFQKKQAIGKSNYLIKLIIKIALVFFLFLIILLLVDQINFPSPNKKIEKIIPNENLKIIK